jgi:20S proteasome alpha/beta subunit
MMKTLYIINVATIIFFTALSLILQVDPTEAAHARKRPSEVRKSSSSTTNTYDKQITTFDPQGHLLQVQYAQRAAERGSSGLFLKIDGGGSGSGEEQDIIVAVVASDNASARTTCTGNSINGNNCSENKGMYRIHDGIMAKMTGLQGDARLLSRHLLANALRMNRYEGGGVDVDVDVDVDGSKDTDGEHILQRLNNRITVKQIAHVSAEVQHSLTMRPGARPLAVDAVLFGLDGQKIRSSCTLNANGNVNQILKLGLYRSRLTGLVEECDYCVVGNICADRLAHTDCLEELEMLWSDLHSKQDARSDSDIVQSKMPIEDNDDPQKPKVGSHLSQTVVKMGEVLLKCQQKQLQQQLSNSSQEEDSDPAALPVAVDIYIMRPNVRGRGGVQISCATCIKEQDLGYVANLFQKETRT